MTTTETALLDRPTAFAETTCTTCGQGLDVCTHEHCPRCGCTLTHQD